MPRKSVLSRPAESAGSGIGGRVSSCASGRCAAGFCAAANARVGTAPLRLTTGAASRQQSPRPVRLSRDRLEHPLGQGILDLVGIHLPGWAAQGYGDVMQQLRAATEGGNAIRHDRATTEQPSSDINLAQMRAVANDPNPNNNNLPSPRAAARGLGTCVFPVTIPSWSHPFPFRTRPLSPPAPMVLPG